MFRVAPRAVLRASTSSLPRAGASRRFLSTAPPTQKSRSWKSSAVRWGLAAGAVYYYNTSDVFAEQPAFATIPETENDSEQVPTIELISAQKQQRLKEAALKEAAYKAETAAVEGAPQGQMGGAAELEEEADQQAAFNPETGEINWDCPCLGGMAHGPCGEEFRAAFSCFVYSKEEPKGMDCIENFKGMQDCFRKYPEIYGEEIDDDDNVEGSEGKDVEAAAAAPKSEAPESGLPKSTPNHERAEKVVDSKPLEAPHPESEGRKERAKQATKQVKEQHAPVDESERAVPAAWHSGK
ncbi:hypothetical protein K490DRAFT_72424 [Saccharata proteae CBS 121410]|uniref:Mitochondrial intermembrane space import and assembly protein 40 n=1 Tax=Saccharata proteae CBS 121410 TaxID=1314787 RepID=A0A6A5YFZ7_9PEZI|nr:hypothetical protein K490DRAFT_72424 [Saccharata proteae CBS 121410]